MKCQHQSCHAEGLKKYFEKITTSPIAKECWECALKASSVDPILSQEFKTVLTCNLSDVLEPVAPLLMKAPVERSTPCVHEFLATPDTASIRSNSTTPSVEPSNIGNKRQRNNTSTVECAICGDSSVSLPKCRCGKFVHMSCQEKVTGVCPKDDRDLFCKECAASLHQRWLDSPKKYKCQSRNIVDFCATEKVAKNIMQSMIKNMTSASE